MWRWKGRSYALHQHTEVYPMASKPGPILDLLL